ncbi:Nucleolar protein 12 [Golovinomyces cichoracearum]|uniref:Nucleolar protein 12 n=1 Tax=Golovinomyces cichoracearum TaxID=62708 RepID=A0A420IRU6_9PEZI|nr:Nucleolar protein 12 [Golovinomyces cichoracearum]
MGLNKIKGSLLVDQSALDPNLSLLFESSVKPALKSSKNPSAVKQKFSKDDHRDSEGKCNIDMEPTKNTQTIAERDENDGPSNSENILWQEKDSTKTKTIDEGVPVRHRKRKRNTGHDDLEDKYMQKLMEQEVKEQKLTQSERKVKHQKLLTPGLNDENESDDSSGDDSEASGAIKETIPIHESKDSSIQDNELEKSSRTIFLANVSTLAISSKKAKKTLLTHLGSFLSELPAPPDGTPAHKVESLRFRSTAFAGSGLPKKAAFAKKEFMPATTKSTNAYVVYSNAYTAREAVKRLNGTMVLDRHLRVDSVAHPSKADHRRCVFVGNLGFVDDESSLDETTGMVRKRSKIPADVEEGLWRQFEKAGTVESVRVIRDEKTRVGKGFAYVQFLDQNSVEAALLFNGKKYPPMLPRILRVVRAKAISKTAGALSASHSKLKSSKPISKLGKFSPKLTSEQLSLRGRAAKLLGVAGAAKLKRSDSVFLNGRERDQKKTTPNPVPLSEDKILRPAESFVFEGYRASAKSSSNRSSKPSGKARTRSGKPKTRSSRRASEWKKKSNNKN